MPWRSASAASVMGMDGPATAARLLVRCLQNEGVTVVFGIPGEENIRFTRALDDSPIRYVLTRHEQAASFMAEMYGRVTGQAAVVSATLGPGAINLQLGVADAFTNSTPMVAISAQVGQHRNYKESHQFVDLVGMFAPITKWSAAVPGPGAIPEMVRKAFKTAETERPGAVYLAVPEDVDEAAADAALAPLRRNVVRPEAPSPSQIARAAQLLRAAHSPILLAGHGAARAAAQAAVARFAETFDIPVATTFHGKGVLADDHPCAVGTVGFMHRDYVKLRLRRRRSDHRRGLRTAGVRPGPDQPGRRQTDHPHPPVPGRGRRSLHHRRRHRRCPRCVAGRARRRRRLPPHTPPNHPVRRAATRRTRQRPGR
jgi:acetolactate synthase I/II/III large subunit